MSGLALIRVWFGGMAKEEETAVLIYLGCCAVLAFATAILLALQGASPVAAAHAAFAVGAMPLVFAAMGHFVPVLTRTGGEPSGLRHLPRWMQAAGALAVGGLAGVLPGVALHGAAVAGLVGAGALLAWVRRRGRRTLGRPHPGVAWYAAALGCLMVALLAILVGLAWPAAYPALRLAHLHLNTLGFIGLTALGTLQVLMPTVLGVQDPGAVVRLHGHLRWALAAVGLTALAAGVPTLAVAGGGLYGGLLGLTVVTWWRTWGARLLRDGAAASLLARRLPGADAEPAVVAALPQQHQRLLKQRQRPRQHELAEAPRRLQQRLRHRGAASAHLRHDGPHR